MMKYSPVQTTPFSLKEKILSRFWTMINFTLYRYSPFMSRKFRVALVRLFGGNISWSCSLNRLSVIEYPWNLTMGDLSSLGKNSWIYCLDKIDIGRNCCIGNDVYLLTGSHELNSSTFDMITNPITIEDGVWVSTRAIILPNVVIANHAVVAAGSVVTKDVESYSIVGGNPAKFIKKRIIDG